MKLTDTEIAEVVRRWTRGLMTLERLMYATCDCGYLLPKASDPHDEGCGYTKAKAMIREPWEKAGLTGGFFL